MGGGGKGATTNGKLMYIKKTVRYFLVGVQASQFTEKLLVFSYFTVKSTIFIVKPSFTVNILWLVITFNKFHEESDNSITVLRKIYFNSSRSTLWHLITSDGVKKELSRFTRKQLGKSRITIILPYNRSLALSLPG